MHTHWDQLIRDAHARLAQLQRDADRSRAERLARPFPSGRPIRRG